MLRAPVAPLYELPGYRPAATSLLAKQHVAEAAAAASGSAELPSGAAAAVGPRDPRREQQQLRRKINSRERKRMQDLNLAMDALREVIVPYSAAHCQSSPGRKLSKIATLLLARNYILLLGSSLQELRRVLGDLSGGAGGGGPPRLLLATAGLPLFATAAPSPVLLSPPGALGLGHHHHHHHHHPQHHPDSLRSAGKFLSVALEEPPPMLPCGQVPLPGGAGLCTCGACKFPHLVPATAALGLAAAAAVQAAQFSK